jgi:hypothetical protein
MATSMIGTQVGTSHGPDGGCIYDLAIDPVTPTTLYAGTARGVFKSMNSGEKWSAVESIPTDSAVFALALDPAMPAALYAGTEMGDVVAVQLVK